LNHLPGGTINLQKLIEVDAITALILRPPSGAWPTSQEPLPGSSRSKMTPRGHRLAILLWCTTSHSSVFETPHARKNWSDRATGESCVSRLR